MGKINLSVGDTIRFSKTISESDVYQFAGIIGDFSPIHIDEEFSKKTPVKTRIAQGTLTLALTNTLAYLMTMKMQRGCLGIGFDRVRFLKPVCIGDTVTAVFTVDEIDEERMRIYNKCVMCNQRGEEVLVCTHIVKALEE